MKRRTKLTVKTAVGSNGTHYRVVSSRLTHPALTESEAASLKEALGLR